MARHLSRTVFIKNLNLNTTEADLRYYFGQGGPIKRVEIERDDDYRNKGFGYIYYDRPQDADWAVDNMNGYLLDGHRIVVEFNKVRLRRKREDRKFKINILQKELETRIHNEKVNQMKDSNPQQSSEGTLNIPPLNTPTYSRPYDHYPSPRPYENRASSDREFNSSQKSLKHRKRSSSSSSSSSSYYSDYSSDSSSSYSYSSTTTDSSSSSSSRSSSSAGSSSYTSSSSTSSSSYSSSSPTSASSTSSSRSTSSSTTSDSSTSSSSYTSSYSSSYTSSYSSSSSETTPPPKKSRKP